MLRASLKSTERTLQDAQDLLGKIERQNQSFPGAGALESDLAEARTLLQRMVVTLSDLIAILLNDSSAGPDLELESEAQAAFNKAAGLISELYDDVRVAQSCLDEGKTQSVTIAQAGVHMRKLVQHCNEACLHLLEAKKMVP